MKSVTSILTLFLCVCPAVLAEPSAEPRLQALSGEIGRAMEMLGSRKPAPYFVGVELTDSQSVQILGESGGVHDYHPDRRWWVDVDLRIGSRDLDSSHALRSGNDRPQRGGRLVPSTTDPTVLRHALWLEIDERYQAARSRWAKVESESKVLVEEAAAEDLVRVEIARTTGELQELEFDARRWEETVATASRVLVEDPAVFEGSVRFSGRVQNQWFASSEGAAVRHAGSHYRLQIQLGSIAEDGESLRVFHAWDAHDAAGLPDTATVVARAREMVDTLRRLRAAPLQGPYTGPAILSDRAAGVFFHEIFGHRVEGHRLKRVDNAQTFRNRVGQPILPEFLDVYDDPTLSRIGDQDLNGHYRFDNQGVAASRASLVERGVLRGFLQSRSPVSKDDLSNGHGRRQAGRDAVSRQGNLVVEASGTVPNPELRRELIRLARDAGREYALWVDEIEGGFTFTSRAIPNAFSINAVLVRRVWVDGRPDELVRGVDLIGTPLEAFSKILRAGETERVFNGSCGAESGWVPVAAVAPALLLESIETQRKRKGQLTPPLLPPPLAESSAGATP